MSNPRILLVATVQSHIAQFHQPLIALLGELGIRVDVAARDNLDVKNGLQITGVDRVFDLPFTRSPFSYSILLAYRQLRDLIRSGEYSIVHCNTPVGGLLTRLAARSSRSCGTRVVYTAHGFHFYRGAPLINWLLFYPIEWALAHITDCLITITNEDFQLASRHFAAPTVHVRGVGADPQRFHPRDHAEKLSARSKLNLHSDTFVVLAVGELNRNKNQQILIRALAQLAENGYSAHLLLAGNGPNESALRALATKLGVETAVTFLGYRRDVDELLAAADLLVTVSRREGLPMNVIEAMLSGVPVLASDNRGHRELIQDGYSGRCVPIDDLSHLVSAMQDFIQDPELRRQYSANALRSCQPYTMDRVSRQLSSIYRKQLQW